MLREAVDGSRRWWWLVSPPGHWCSHLECPGWHVPGCSAFTNYVPQPKAVQIFVVLQVCFLRGLLIFLIPEEGSALLTLLTGAVGHWCTTAAAAVNEPHICLHPEEQVAGALWVVT